MARIEDKFLNIELCPIRNVIARFGNKWALLILLVLNEGMFAFQPAAEIYSRHFVEGAFEHVAGFGG